MAKQNTTRKKRLKKIVAEKVRSGAKFTRQQVMIEAGYSPTTASTSNPNVKKTWNEILEQFFPDEVIAHAENGQLNASHIDHFVFAKSISNKEIQEVIESYPNCKLKKISETETTKHAYFFAPDNNAVSKSLDRIYKMKDKYAPEKHKIIGEFDNMTDEELDERLKELQQKIARFKKYKKE